MRWKENLPGKSYWLRQIGLIVVGGLYLYFGIRMLIGAYTLKEPLVFILTFFASNFIILISAALIAGFIYQLVAVIRRTKRDPKSGGDSGHPPDESHR